MAIGISSSFNEPEWDHVGSSSPVSKEVSDFELHDGSVVTITRNGDRYTSRTNGEIKQDDLTADEAIGYLCHVAHNAGHRASKAPAPEAVAYQSVGVFPETPEVEDGGAAIIWQPDDGAESGMFVRVQSWDERREHSQIKRLFGKKVRITVEVLD